MSGDSEHGVDIDDSFEALLRQAAHPSHVSRHSALSIGAKLASDRFEITRRIGEGGMGVVYEAFDVERRGKVALKTLSRLDASSIYRLKNEFRALADVSHPNLVRLHELFADEALWFFTMDLVDGVRFDAWVRPEDVLDEARLRAALPQLLRAVLAIHDAGKLHRDLKPSNVLVTRDGSVMVLDFGLAVDPELGGVGQTVADDSVSGTPAYMSPEQAAGDQATVASDFYALGVMLFEALTGKLPFEGRVHEMIVDKQRGLAPHARQVAPDAPDDLSAACDALLAREPAARPDAAALRAQFSLPQPERPSVPSLLVARTVEATPRLLERETDLAALRDAFEASCRAHKPVIVLLAGESGIGKSALCEVFLSELRAQESAVVLSGRCFERESVPFKAFDVVIDGLSRYLRKLPEREMLTLLPRDCYALRRIFPVLGRIVAIADAPSREEPDAHELRRRAFLALGELFGRMRDRQPLVLHLDDLQWSDTDSTLLLMHLVRQADAPKLLLIASHRSEQMQGHPYLTPLYDALPTDVRLDVRQLQLAALSPRAAHELLRGQVGDVREDLVREAGGNPFLLSELGRHAALHAGEPAIDLSLQYVAVARAAELREAERKLLQVLAVASRPIELQVAIEAAGVDAGPRTLFEALRKAHLAKATGDGEHVECFHDKVREALLGALTPAALKAHHAALAAALASRAGADAEQVAVHLLGAGKSEHAAVQFVAAADSAVRELGFDRAARLYALALEHGRFETTEAQRLRVAHAEALAEAGRGPIAAEAYLAAVTTALNEAEAHALEHNAAEQYLLSGRLELGRALLTRTLARHGMRLPRTNMGAIAALVYERTRLKLRGLEFEECRGRAPDAAAIDALRYSRRALTGLDFVGGSLLQAHGLRRALDSGDPAMVAVVLTGEFWERGMGIGDARDVPDLIARVEALVARTGNVEAQRWLHFNLGWFQSQGAAARSMYTLGGALANIDRFLELTEAHRFRNASYDRGLGALHRVNIRMGMGRFAEVARELPELLDGTFGRGDFALAPMLAGAGGTLSFVAVGATAVAERELDRATQAWVACNNAYAFQDYFLLQGTVFLGLAKGDAKGAYSTARDHVARFEKSPGRSSRTMAELVTMAAFWATTGLAVQTHGSERLALGRELQRAQRRFKKDPARTAMTGVALELLAGDTEAAVARLRAHLTAAPNADVWDVALKYMLGALLGGDEGKALAGEAETSLRQGGVADPAHFASILVPSFRPR